MFLLNNLNKLGSFGNRTFCGKATIRFCRKVPRSTAMLYGMSSCHFEFLFGKLLAVFHLSFSFLQRFFSQYSLVLKKETNWFYICATGFNFNDTTWQFVFFKRKRRFCLSERKWLGQCGRNMNNHFFLTLSRYLIIPVFEKNDWQYGQTQSVFNRSVVYMVGRKLQKILSGCVFGGTNCTCCEFLVRFFTNCAVWYVFKIFSFLLKDLPFY